MGADAPRSTQLELFDADLLAVTRGDVRTVGEMLAEVEYLSRNLLFEVDGESADSLIRGWPTLLEAARDFWMALPQPAGDPHRNAASFRRLDAHTAAFARSLRRGWPGPGATDPRLHRARLELLTAAALVRRYGPEMDPETPRALASIAASRASVMRILHITSHAVGVAVRSLSKERCVQMQSLAEKPTAAGIHLSCAIHSVDRWLPRLSTIEQLAGGHLGGVVVDPTAADPDPPKDAARLPRALAAWEVQCHRTLAARGAAVDLVLIARTEALVTSTLLLLVSGEHRQLETAAAPSWKRLAVCASTTASRWHGLAGRWDDLAAPWQRHDPDLVQASAELHAALRELDVIDVSSDPVVPAIRPVCDRVRRALLESAPHGPDLAEIFIERAQQRDLLGRAGPVSRRACDDIEAGTATPGPDPDVAWVSPVAIRERRLVPLPPPVREALQQASGALGRSAASLASLASLHTSPSPTARPGGGGCEPGRSVVRPPATQQTPIVPRARPERAR